MKNHDLKTVLYSIISLFAFFLPISEKISTLIIICAIPLCIINYKNWDYEVLRGTFFLLILYGVYVFAYAKDNTGFGIHWFEKKASLLIFPIIFCFTPIDKERFVRILKSFILGCVVSYFVCLLYPLFFDFNWSEMEFLPLREKSSLLIKNENYNWINYFISIEFSNTIDRAYLACYIVFSLVFIMIFNKEFSKTSIFGLVFFLFLALIQFSSVSGMVSLSMVPLLGLFYFKKTKIRLISICFYLLVFSVFHFTTQRTQEYFKEVSSWFKGDVSDQNNILNDRIGFWKSAENVFYKNPIIGSGIKTSQRMMNQEQQNILGWSEEWVNNSNFNAHNQYLQFLIESGIIGLLIYLFAIIWFFLKLRNYKRSIKFLGVFFIIIFSIHCLSESMMNRYVGIAFFSFFYSLFMSYKNTDNATKES